MRCRAIPYEGNEPFLFLSYCHANETDVYPLFEYLAQKGYRVWYDEANNAGDDWADNIARHLANCAAMIAFITEASSLSHNCNNELNFSIMNNKRVIPVLLESFAMPMGLLYQLSSSHYLKKSNFPSDEALMDKVCHADGIDVCLDKTGSQKLREREDPEDKPNEDVAIDKEKEAFQEQLKRGLEKKTKDPVKEDPPVIDEPEKQEDDPQNEVMPNENSGQAADDPIEVDPDNEDEKEYPLFELDNEKTVYDSPSIKKSLKTDDDEKTQKAINTDQIMLILPSSGASYITSERNVVIGRSKAKSHFVIENQPTIGRAHASILHSDKKYYLKDLDSTNGTYYQGDEVKDGKVIELNAFDIFKLHNEPVIFVSGKTLVQAIATGRLAVVMSEQRTGIQALATGSIPLNRNHKWPDGTMSDKRVHRDGHARLEMKYDGCYLVEEGPKAPNPNNGTFLNDHRLGEAKSCKLNNEDKIRLGDNVLTFMLFEIKGAK